jgi:Protein of unknown function (DUF1439)
MTLRRAIMLALLVIATAIGGAYYYFYGKEYVYRFDEAQLRQALSGRLPIQRSYLLIFQVTLDNPRVTLANGSDRVNAGLDVTLNIHMGREPLPLSGSVDISGGIRYDSGKGQLFLTRPAIEHLELQGIPEQYASRVTSALTKALDEYYTDHPIYTLSTLNAKQLAARLILKSVVVKEQELVVTLGIGN